MKTYVAEFFLADIVVFTADDDSEAYKYATDLEAELEKESEHEGEHLVDIFEMDEDYNRIRRVF